MLHIARLMASASKPQKTNKSSKKTTSTAQVPNTTKSTAGKNSKRRADENDPSNPTKRANTGSRPPTGTAHANSSERTSGLEPQMSVDEMVQKYAELQGQIDIIRIYKILTLPLRRIGTRESS
jgi:hypothetical protein